MKTIWKLGFLILPLMFLVGCMSGVKNIGGEKFGLTEEELHGGEPGVKVIQIASRDLTGQELKTQAILEYDGRGNHKTTYASQGGGGIVHDMAPSTASGAFIYAGMESLEPDQTNVEANGGNGGRGGDATAEAGAEADASASAQSSGWRSRVQKIKPKKPPTVLPPPGTPPPGSGSPPSPPAPGNPPAGPNPPKPKTGPGS